MACQFSLSIVGMRATLDVISVARLSVSLLPSAPLVKSSCDVGNSLHGFLAF